MIKMLATKTFAARIGGSVSFTRTTAVRRIACQSALSSTSLLVLQKNSPSTSNGSGSHWLSVAAVTTAAAVAGLDPVHTEESQDDDEHVFVNWSASHECRPREFFVPESVDELEQLLSTFQQSKQKLRCMGAGVSPNGLGFSSINQNKGDATESRSSRHEALLSMALFDKILHVDKERMQVTVEAGIIVGELLDKLRTYGLTMQNVASIRDQQVGGITQAGCHGTGASIPPIDDQIVEMEIVTPAQGRMTLSATQSPELFALAKCGLGALGVVTKLTLQCVPAHYLAEKTFVTTVSEIRIHHQTWLQEFQHLRYMWIPNTDAVVVVQCQHISVEDAALSASKFPPVPHSRDVQLHAPRELYLQLADGNPDPELLDWNFTKLRDKLLAFNPLDKQHVVRVNQVEKQFWLLNQGYRVGLSDDIIGFDCGGQQLVQEVAFPTAETLDIDFVEKLLQGIETSDIPAPAPIEQRWTARSTSLMSPAVSYNPNQLFCWVGIILYLPTQDPMMRGAIWDRFFDYHRLYRNVMAPFGGMEHWAKIEWPSEPAERQEMRERLRRRYPIDAFKKARDYVDPHHILSNHIVDELCS